MRSNEARVALLGVGALTLVLASTGCTSGYSKCTSNSDCGAGQFCDVQLKTCFSNGTPLTDGGNPVNPRVWSLAWVSPAQDSVLRISNETVTAKLTPPQNSQATLPSSISLTTSPADPNVPTTLVLDGGLYEATWGPSAENTYTLTASYAPPDSDAGTLTASRTLKVDRPPNLGIFVPPPVWHQPVLGTTYGDPNLPKAFRRDDSATVTVYSSSNDVSSAQLFVTDVRDGGARPQEVSLNPCVDAGTFGKDHFCGQATLALENYRLDALDGTFDLIATTQDTGGNSADAGAGLAVTRWDWSRGTTNNIAITTPAIGHDGSIYVGVTTGQGGLLAITPDGMAKWANPPGTGPIESPPAVGTAPDGGDRIYVLQAIGGNGYGLAAYDGTGNSIGNCSYGGGQAPASPTSISIVPADAGTDETALAVIDDGSGQSNGVLIAWQPDNGNCKASTSVNPTLGPPKPPPVLPSDPQGAIAGNGGAIYFGTSNISANSGAVESYAFNGTGWALTSGWSDGGTQVGFNIPSVVVQPGTGVAGGGGVGAGGFFLIPSDGGAVSTQPASGFSKNYGVANNAISSASGNLFAGVTQGNDGTRVVRLKFEADGGESEQFTNISNQVTTAPLLTKDGHLFALSDNGTLYSFDSATLAPLGGEDLGVTGTTAPNIDCARFFDGGTVSNEAVLYFGTSDGHLDAILVDSAGLDTTLGGWPKYLHDPRNTDNAQTDLSQFACP